MKNIRKLFAFMVFSLLVLSLVGCKNDSMIKIGILQYISHDALDNARLGFIQALEEAGYIDGENIKINYLNPQAEASTMQTQAAKLVRESDLVLAIATPAAQAVNDAAKNIGKKIPILFTAVTDPVDAGLVESMEKPGGNVTGTSDMNPVAEQISLVKELKPEASKIGIIYTSSESNSEIQANIAKDVAIEIGLVPTVSTISTLSDIQAALTNLITNVKVDAIYVPTDNLLASSMGAIETIITEYKSFKVPVIAGETSQVRTGGSITYGLSYFNLGHDTGKMAVRIIKGDTPADIAVTMVSVVDLVINKKQLEEVLGLVVPEILLLNASEVLE